MADARWWTSVAQFRPYPLAIVLIGLLTLFVNAGEPLRVLPRPVLVTAIVVLGMQSAASLVLGGPGRGALATLGALLLVAGMWPLALALLTMPAWWLLIAGVRRARGEAAPSTESLRIAQRAMDTFSVALLAIVVVSGFISGAFHLYGPPAGTSRDEPAAPAPNIYLVQLDAYPSLDSLRTRLAIDAEPFARALDGMGFELIRDARSNYTQTWMTLASMFEMSYFHERPGVLPVSADLGEQRRRLARIANDGRFLAELRERGYRVVTVPSAFSSAALLTADEVIEGGQMNEYEELLLRKSGIMRMTGDLGQAWVADQTRDRIEYGFDALADADTPTAPTFFFNHILAPHPPFLFQADGSATSLRDCYPVPCPFWVSDLAATGAKTAAEYADALSAELTYLNARLLEALQSVIDRDPTAIVLIFSDHGLRFDALDTAEHFEILLAVRTPGETGVYNSEASLVNLFPTLLNKYFEAAYTPLPYRAWQSGELPLDLTPVVTAVE